MLVLQLIGFLLPFYFLVHTLIVAPESNKNRAYNVWLLLEWIWKPLGHTNNVIIAMMIIIARYDKWRACASHFFCFPFAMFVRVGGARIYALVVIINVCFPFLHRSVNYHIYTYVNADTLAIYAETHVLFFPIHNGPMYMYIEFMHHIIVWQFKMLTLEKSMCAPNFNDIVHILVYIHTQK